MSKKIIIVGNGSSLLSRKNGSLIDSFDVIVRFNSYKIKGYEEYVGKKTNIWFTVNLAHIAEINSYDRVIEHCWEWNPEKDKNFQKLNAIRACEKTSRDFVRTKIDCKNPSTGLIAIYMFLEDERYNKPMYITGFDWWKTKKHHYGDNERRGTLHNPKEEYKIIVNLLNKGKVKFL